MEFPSQLVKYRHCGLVVSPTYEPKRQYVMSWENKLSNQLYILQIRPLRKIISSKHFGQNLQKSFFLQFAISMLIAWKLLLYDTSKCEFKSNYTDGNKATVTYCHMWYTANSLPCIQLLLSNLTLGKICIIPLTAVYNDPFNVNLDAHLPKAVTHFYVSLRSKVAN